MKQSPGVPKTLISEVYRKEIIKSGSSVEMEKVSYALKDQEVMGTEFRVMLAQVNSMLE